MRKSISVLRYVAVLFLTIAIFSLGVLIGGDVEQMRVQNLYTQLQEQDLLYQNIVTEGNYIDYLVSQKEAGEDISCDTIEGAYFTSIKNLDDSRLKLEDYINTAKVKEEEYQRLRGHYTNTQINYLITAKKIKGLCNSDYDVIVYFFSTDKKQCPACEDQGTHLSYVKAKKGDDVLIFSLDADNPGAAHLIAQNYDVPSRELPVVVINDKVHPYITNEQIFKELNN